jgi:hypothetical protein
MIFEQQRDWPSMPDYYNNIDRFFVSVPFIIILFVFLSVRADRRRGHYLSPPYLIKSHCQCDAEQCAVLVIGWTSLCIGMLMSYLPQLASRANAFRRASSASKAYKLLVPGNIHHLRTDLLHH